MPQQRFVIQRYDPTDDRSYEQEFAVDYQPGWTVLDCINEIKWTQDGTLSYRMACRHAICGSCAWKINDKSQLACKTQVTEAATRGDPIRIGPMGNQAVIKDLVVDADKFMRQFERAQTWFQPHDDQEPPRREYRQSKDDYDYWQHATSCIHCGACYSDCTVASVDDRFLGPAALAKAYRFVFDSRDAKTDDRLKALSNMAGGMWDCTRCFMCVEACPKDVLPMDAIMELRTEAIRRGLTNTHGARHSKAFSGGVKKRGRLDEAALPILSAGLRLGAIPELIGYAPGALRLLRSGKLLQAARRHGASKAGRKQISRIFDEVEEEKGHAGVDRESFSSERDIALGR